MLVIGVVCCKHFFDSGRTPVVKIRGCSPGFNKARRIELPVLVQPFAGAYVVFL
jgi:hypothetical protein